MTNRSPIPVAQGHHTLAGRCRFLLVLMLLGALSMPMAATAAPDTQGGVYVVQRGDTLSKIAARLGVSSTSLAQANGLSNTNFVWVGQRLVIPGGSTASAAKPAAQTAAGGVYVVQPGDNLAKIAARNGTTVQALLTLNGLRNANFVYVGQRLSIPGGQSTQQVTQPAAAAPAASTASADPKSGRWIDVNLTTQTLAAYEGQTPVFTTKISSGLPRTPTVVGTYKIYRKLTSQRMVGPGYNLPNVPYVMYFYKGYAIHGAYWHNNFGHPMSHGCVNTSTQDSAWLYGWASMGTPVVTHY